MANNLVTATCPNCNSPLQIKEGQDFVKCEYCGTISSAPKAIEYHQHQSTSYNFSGANPVVNFSNGQDLETLVKNADMHLKLKITPMHNQFTRRYQKNTLMIIEDGGD